MSYDFPLEIVGDVVKKPLTGNCADRPPFRRYEYLALVGSFVLIGLEAVIRVLTLALRTLPIFAVKIESVG